MLANELSKSPSYRGGENLQAHARSNHERHGGNGKNGKSQNTSTKGGIVGNWSVTEHKTASNDCRSVRLESSKKVSKGG